MATMSGVAVLNAYFGKMKVAEFKLLTPEDRRELADGAAADLGLTKTTDGGKITYVGELPPDYVVPDPLFA